MNAKTLPYALYALITVEIIVAVWWTLFNFNIFVMPIWVFVAYSAWRLHAVAQRLLRRYS